MIDSKLKNIIYRLLICMPSVYPTEKISPLLGFDRNELEEFDMQFVWSSESEIALTGEQKHKVLKAFEVALQVYTDNDFGGKVGYKREQVQDAYNQLKEIWK